MSMQNALLLTEVKPVAQGLAISHPIDDMTDEEIVTSWAMLNRLEALIAARKLQLRERLLEITENLGDATPEGHYRYFAGGHEITKQRSQAHVPNADEFSSLLAAKEIDQKEAFDEVKRMELNPSKVQYLVKTGRITQAEVDKLRPVSYRLRVDVASEYGAQIDAATKAPEFLKPYFKRSADKTK